jgi:hypothetical protein
MTTVETCQPSSRFLYREPRFSSGADEAMFTGCAVLAVGTMISPSAALTSVEMAIRSDAREAFRKLRARLESWRGQIAREAMPALG